jgi:hypothetical protein
MREAPKDAATEENAAQEEEGRDLVAYGSQIPALPDEVVETIIEDGKDAVLWLKVTDGGFRYGDDTFIKEIVGLITNCDRYWVRWEDGNADRLYDVPNDDPPAGYEIRADIQIQTADSTTYGISLAPTSYIYGFSQYVRNLKERGLNVAHVPTRLWTEQRHNKFGVFNVVRFAAAQEIKLFDRKAEDSENEEIPF